MDPFFEVEKDGWVTIGFLKENLKKLKNGDKIDKLEFEQNFKYVNEVCNDLNQAIKISEKNQNKFKLSFVEIESRKEKLKNLQASYDQIKKQWNEHFFENNVIINNIADTVSESNEKINFFESRMVSNQFHDTKNILIKEQDQMLKTIHDKMKVLNHQARLVTSELEEQNQMIDDFDNNVSLFDSKLKLGTNKIKSILNSGSGRKNDCYILIIIIFLMFLLIIVILI